MDTRQHFCTLFDLGFLPQGLSLHASLRRHLPDATLWVLCMDDEALSALERLALPGIRLVTLTEVEDPDLLAIKPGRTRGEYCWTLTSHLLSFLLEREGMPLLTYLDADLWFRDSPLRLLEPLDAYGADTLLTPHDYDPEHDQTAASGRHCVQFVPFRNNPRGLSILRWWKDRCLEWCFARQEPGRFGDQKYLDEWIPRFGDAVLELPEPGWTLGPWNCRKHVQAARAAVCFHFHGLRIHRNWRVCLWRMYRIPSAIGKTFYEPYLADLAAARSAIESHGIEPRLSAGPSKRIPDAWRRFRRFLDGTERWSRVPAAPRVS